LKASGKTLTNGSTFDIAIPADAQRVVIAYPATLKDLDYVLDVNDSSANIVSAFTNEDGTAKATVSVAGANNYSAVDYKVFSTDFAGAYGAINTFKVKIKA
jgi:Mrp family chromosome partitioning ATPase